MFNIANQRYTSCKQKLLSQNPEMLALYTCKTIEVTDCKQSVKLV